MRTWFHDHGFVEIQAPTLVRSPALEEHLEALSVRDGDTAQGYLHTSPEFALKRVLAAGLPRIYAITPCFRGQEWGPTHSTEFTMLEWYRAGTDHRGIQRDTESLVRAAAEAVGVAVPAFAELTQAQALEIFGQATPPVDPDERMRMWVNDVEPRLTEPTFITGYPAADAAFSELRGDRAERFELYWRGVELANAFTELRDPDELVARWTASNAARQAQGKAPYPIDPRVVDAVARHPRAGGIALGVDRLVALLLGATDLRQIQVLG
jgi:lysyl-tRNA synthetase class 2